MVFGAFSFLKGGQTAIGFQGAAIGGGLTYASVTSGFDLIGYVISPALIYGGNVIDRFRQCGQCLYEDMSSAEIAACSDKMLICLYEQDS